MPTEALRRGDLVEVRSPAEILATLDERGSVGGLPFMPEMVSSCGQRFHVVRRAEKLCDTVNYLGSRRLHDAVILDGGRCSGDAHDGCQAECVLYWKEVWLREVEPADAPRPVSAGEAAPLLARITPRTRPGDVYFCQLTELQRASERLAYFDPRPFVRELATSNVSLGEFVTVTARAVVDETKNKLGMYPHVHFPGSRAKGVTDPPLDLQPGELVRVKSLPEVLKTLGPDGKNRGLWFDREMAVYCGQTLRVRRRVSRFIDDRTSRMTALKTDAVTLEGGVCQGNLSLGRWFCPRAIYSYWREAWLERVEETPGFDGGKKA